MGSLPVGGADTGSRSHVQSEKRSKVRLFRKGKGKGKFQVWLEPKRHLSSVPSMTHPERWGNFTSHWNIRTSSLRSHLNTLALKGQVRLNSIPGVRMNSAIFSEDVLVINFHTLDCPGTVTTHNQGTRSFSFQASWIKDKRLMGRTSIIPAPF